MQHRVTATSHTRFLRLCIACLFSALLLSSSRPSLEVRAQTPPSTSTFWSAPTVNLQPLGNLTRNMQVDVLNLDAAINNAITDAQSGRAPLTTTEALEVRYDVIAAAVALQGHLNQPQFFGSAPLLWLTLMGSIRQCSHIQRPHAIHHPH